MIATTLPSRIVTSILGHCDLCKVTDTTNLIPLISPIELIFSSLDNVKYENIHNAFFNFFLFTSSQRRTETKLVQIAITSITSEC